MMQNFNSASALMLKKLKFRKFINKMENICVTPFSVHLTGI